MINYYVLGKKDNKMLQEYLDKYLIVVLSKFKSLLTDDLYNKLINTVGYEKFILTGDISALIYPLINKINKDEDYNKYYNLLLRELQLFVDGKSEECICNKGQFIGNTQIRLTMDDLNPYNQFEAHPEHKKTGGVIGWGVYKEEKWLKIYKATFALLKKVDEGFYDELNKIINKIIPLGTSDCMHNSASYTECIGHLYMGFVLGSEQPEISNLEAIIHESSHNKLNLLFQFDKIILNDLTENYYSPFRPDARHIKGVFLAIHAFVPTIYILMKAYKQGNITESHWLNKIVLFYIKNKITYKVLKKYAHFTSLGEDVMKEVEYVMKLTDQVFKSLQIDKKIIVNTMEQEKKHFKSVNDKYPNFKY